MFNAQALPLNKPQDTVVRRQVSSGRTNVSIYEKINPRSETTTAVVNSGFYFD